MDTERPIKILIVEDESITAMDVAHMLRGWGWDVVGIAATGGDAIEQALSLRPDVVLMDIRLRGIMDGVSAAQRIHTRLDIPVIYVEHSRSIARVEESRAILGPDGIPLVREAPHQHAPPAGTGIDERDIPARPVEDRCQYATRGP